MEKPKIKDILDKFKADYKASKTYHDQKMTEIDKSRAIYNADLYGNEVDNKSQLVSKDARRQSEWLHSTLVAPFMDEDIIKATPITYEDELAARQNELVINTQFCRKFNRYKFLSKAIKILDMDGTVVIQCGWESETETTEVDRPIIVVDEQTKEEYIGGMETVTETVTVKNQPTAKVRRNEDVYIDPTCQDDMEDCQFVITRYESNLSTLQSDGRYKNLDKIKKQISDPDNDQDYEELENGSFMFEDNPRKKLLVYEYWGNYDIDCDGIAEPIVCVWVNDTVIRLQGNPYPDKQLPFVITSFNSKPFEMYGEANAALIDDSQKLKTAIIRGMVDNLAQSNNGQVITTKNALDSINAKKMANGENFEVNTSINDIKHGSYNQLPGSVFDMIGLANNDIESITGVMNMNDKGLSGGIGGSAAGAQGVLDATSTRRLNTVRNIAENMLKPLIRKWMAYNAVFLEPEEVVRITNSEYVTVKRDDLQGRVDIAISVSTPEDNKLKSDKIAFMLQTMGPSMDPDVQYEMMADWADLNQFPVRAKMLRDQADKIRERMSQPDPYEEEMKQIELDKMRLANEKTKAEIAAIYAGGQEDTADQMEKQAKAQHLMAQTAKLNADTDLVKEKTDTAALEFLKADNGISHLEKLEIEDQKNQAKLQMEQMKLQANMVQMQYQAQQNDKNIGVVQ